ncbi:MAG TPA: exodeoxyribonuclease VII small subunit [Phycisphaerae bacterium]|nr:exodeoxyribonuclease VII small subunit [Phycisphaerae bacterium]HRR87277.1 exodeoxyribonuclease VII small subunit [Phycisphaerae bacterium]
MPSASEPEKKGEQKEQLTFEQAYSQLESIAKAIEQGKIGLEDSIVEYEKGVKLLRYCRAVLAEAELKVQKLQVADDGTLTPGPMPPPDEETA